MPSVFVCQSEPRRHQEKTCRLFPRRLASERVEWRGQDSQMDSLEKTTHRSEQKSSRKFLKSLVQKQPQELLLVIGTGVSAAAAPGIPALCSWRSCLEAVIETAEQLDVLHPGDAAQFRRKVTKDRDLLVVAHDLIRKMSPRTGDTKPNFFQDCLMEIFDNLEQHLQHPQVLQSILSLMDRGTMVLTTNYDNLLEIFGQQQNRPMESLDLKDKTKVLQWARGHIKYGVLHIHGLYTDPCGMVLDPSGYKDVTQDPEVMMPTEWTAPRWGVGARTAPRGSWRRTELKLLSSSGPQMMLAHLEIFKTDKPAT
ncbi:protein FAM118A isoform X6 [Myotis myotis]|uniref:protein FAM118A isoform X6 n=1 Tax=Myotis myotis TaxID=51298 RepID=UPI00174B5CFE|nr:protein FAM118A isoform X6 [Myotis myotis]